MKKFNTITVLFAWFIPLETGVANYAPVELNQINYVAPTIEEIIIRELGKRNYNHTLIQLIVAQSKHETGFYSSVIMWENFNLFGMKLPKKRKTTAIGERYGHAVYQSFEDSVIDYCYYLEFTKCPFLTKDTVSVKDWVSWLKHKRYFEDNYYTYKRGVQYFLNLPS